MGLQEESIKLKNILEKIIRPIVKEETKSCLRLYKAKIITAPNDTTCEVQLVGDKTTMNLPFSSAVSSAVEGDLVWVATLYDSFSNAVVYNFLNFGG